MSETNPVPKTDWRFLFLVLAATLLLQFVLVSVTFPLSELLTDKPLFHIDSAWHWYHIKVAEDLWETGRIVGYDPTFNAGYPGGVTFNWSGKAPAVLAILFKSHLSESAVYKLYAFISALIAPLCVPLALSILRARRGEILMGTLFGFILWWTSMFHWYHTAGMVSFVAGSYVSLVYLAKVLQYLEEGGKIWQFVVLGLVGALATFWHPLFPVPVAIGTVVYFVLNARSIDWTNLIKVMAVVPVLAVLPNLFWVYAMFHYQKVFVAGLPDISPYGKVVAISNLWMELAGVWKGEAHGSKIYLPIAVAALWGCCVGAKTQKRRSLVFVSLAVILTLVAHLGGGIPMFSFLQPNRFAPVAYLFACVAAAIGVFAMLPSAQTSSATWIRWVGRGSLAVVALVTTYSVNEVRQEVSWTHAGHYGAPPPEVRGVGDLSRWVVDWLEKDTTTDGRVLFETSKGRIHDGAHMAGYYAYTSGRQFIGGPYPFTNFAGFWDGFLFGQPIAQIPQTTFQQYLDTYNIGWVLAYSEDSKKYLDRMPGLSPMGSYQNLKAYRCERRLSYFLEGSGRVERQGINQLVLSDLGDNQVVLKFHYIPGLKSDPPASLAPVRVMDDPNPFVKIVNPPKRIRLFM